MGRFCSNCGAPLTDNDKFCTSCGMKVEEAAPNNADQGNAAPNNAAPENNTSASGSGTGAYQETTGAGSSQYQEAFRTEAQNTTSANTAGITERSIALAIIFTIITCGIYGLYWIYKMNEDLNQITGDTGATSGGLVIVLSIVTCGIYAIYWSYKMGQKVDQLTGSDSNKILFLVLAIFGLEIVNLAIMQDTVNKEITK